MEYIKLDNIKDLGIELEICLNNLSNLFYCKFNSEFEKQNEIKKLQDRIRCLWRNLKELQESKK